MGPWSWWPHALSALSPLSLCSLCALSAPARRVVAARPPCVLGTPAVRMPVGRRSRYARPSSEWRLRSAPPPASLRSAQPKGFGETELPRRHVRPRTCTDIDTDAQKKAAENQRLINAQRNDRFLLPLQWLQQLNEDVLGWVLGRELGLPALLFEC